MEQKRYSAGPPPGFNAGPSPPPRAPGMMTMEYAPSQTPTGMGLYEQTYNRSGIDPSMTGMPSMQAQGKKPHLADTLLTDQQKWNTRWIWLLIGGIIFGTLGELNVFRGIWGFITGGF